MGWRNKINKRLKPHIEKQIKEIFKYKKEILNSGNPRYLQLWYAIGNLSREIFDLNLKVKFLEDEIRQTVKKNVKKKIMKKRK